MATYSSILAWEILWTQEPDGLQSMGLQRVIYNLATKQQQQQHSIVYTYQNVFICSSADGHLGCFHVLAIVNSAAVSIGVHVCLFEFWFSLGICPANGLFFTPGARKVFEEGNNWWRLIF